MQTSLRKTKLKNDQKDNFLFYVDIWLEILPIGLVETDKCRKHQFSYSYINLNQMRFGSTKSRLKSWNVNVMLFTVKSKTADSMHNKTSRAINQSS